MKFDLGDGDGDGDDSSEGGDGDPCEQAAQANSNQGCEFWAVDLPNAWVRAFVGDPSPEEQTFAIVVTNTADDMATVGVYAGNSTTALQTQVVGPGSVATFALDNTYGVPSLQNSLGTAYRVESDLPITVYQFNPLDNSTPVFSNDASLVFPTHVLANDYTAITGDGIVLGGSPGDITDDSGAFVSVVATQDGTNVEIQPPAGVTLNPGALSLTIGRGQVMTVISQTFVFPGPAGQGNLSGSRIIANKPVAVFSGNVATIEPQPGNCCADHMEHQMLPLTAWGSKYVAAPAPSAGTNPGGSDRVAFRLTGSFDGTTLTYSPAAPANAPTTINAYQTVRFETDQAFTVTGTQPFALTEFVLSNGALNDNAGGTPGDPAMILAPASEQFQDRYVFLTPSGYAADWVTVFRPTGTSVSLDGSDISTGNWQPIGMVDGTAWEFAHFPLSDGQHVIESADGTGIGIKVIGYDADVSYGYPGGSGAEFIAEPPPPPVG